MKHRSFRSGLWFGEFSTALSQRWEVFDLVISWSLLTKFMWLKMTRWFFSQVFEISIFQNFGASCCISISSLFYYNSYNCFVLCKLYFFFCLFNSVRLWGFAQCFFVTDFCWAISNDKPRLSFFLYFFPQDRSYVFSFWNTYFTHFRIFEKFKVFENFTHISNMFDYICLLFFLSPLTSNFPSPHYFTSP